MKRYDKNKRVMIENEKVDKFLKEILFVCEKHGFTIAHEDHGGAFIINSYNRKLNEWILNAHVSISDNQNDN